MQFIGLYPFRPHLATVKTLSGLSGCNIEWDTVYRAYWQISDIWSHRCFFPHKWHKLESKQRRTKGSVVWEEQGENAAPLLFSTGGSVGIPQNTWPRDRVTRGNWTHDHFKGTPLIFEICCIMLLFLILPGVAPQYPLWLCWSTESSGSWRYLSWLVEGTQSLSLGGSKLIQHQNQLCAYQ